MKIVLYKKHVCVSVCDLTWTKIFFILLLITVMTWTWFGIRVDQTVTVDGGHGRRVFLGLSVLSRFDRPKERMLSTLGARSFYAAAPTLWNSLPVNIREITSLSIFKKKLKAYLFNLAYNKLFLAMAC